MNAPYVYGKLWIIRPIPQAGTPVKIWKGTYAGKTGVYWGQTENLLGVFHRVIFDNGELPTNYDREYLFLDASIMRLI